MQLFAMLGIAVLEKPDVLLEHPTVALRPPARAWLVVVGGLLPARGREAESLRVGSPPRFIAQTRPTEWDAGPVIVVPPRLLEAEAHGRLPLRAQ